MPLVRYDNTPLLKEKFSAFCTMLFECMRRDDASTSSFFTTSETFIQKVTQWEYDTYLRLVSWYRSNDEQPNSEQIDIMQTHYSGSMNSSLKITKETILCAFELTNRGQRNRINKQQLYSFLFIMGLPMGLIAKIILNGELGAVRNGILKHKLFVSHMLDGFFQGYRLSDLKKGFFGDENIGTTRKKRIFYFSVLAYNVGGMNLLRKFLVQADQQEFLGFEFREALRSRSRSENILAKKIIGGDDSYDYEFAFKTLKLYTASFSGERGVRRTGQSLSRNARQERTATIRQIEQQQPSAPTPQENIVILSTPENESIGRSQITPPRTPRVKVRDVAFTNTFGIEIEGSFMVQKVDSIGTSERDHWNKMKTFLREANFTADIINSRGEKTGEGKLGVKQEGSANAEEKAYWKYKYDGSVFGGSPYEFASPILKGKNGIEQLKLICSAMRQSGFYSNATAGLHIHLGAKDLELDTFKNIIYNYTKFEPLVEMMFTSDRRWSNPFYAQSYSTLSNWEQKLDTARNFSQLQQIMMGGRRYFSVNLYAFDRFGTIEFRKLMGTNDDRLIIFFTYYLHYLMEASKRKRLTNFNLKGLQDILPAWAFTYFVDRVRNTSGYDVAYGYDVGQGGDTYQAPNTYTFGGDPMGTPLRTRRGRSRNIDFNA